MDFVLPPSLVTVTHRQRHRRRGRAGVSTDSSCVGPPEWDLVRWRWAELIRDPPERYGELVRHYGFDVMGKEGFARVCARGS